MKFIVLPKDLCMFCHWRTVVYPFMVNELVLSRESSDIEILKCNNASLFLFFVIMLLEVLVKVVMLIPGD